MFVFPERLGQLRFQHNISQSALSKQLGITRATVNAWEMGAGYPNAQSLIDLSRYFKVSVDYLLGLDNAEMINIEHLNATEKEIVLNLINYFTNCH